MASSTTPTRRTRAGWTASGACTSGSTARHSVATRPASGSAATTSTTATETDRLGSPGRRPPRQLRPEGGGRRCIARHHRRRDLWSAGAERSGETSTLSAIEGLVKPDAGSIRIGDVDARANPAAAKARMGVQLQSTSFQSNLTIREIVRLYAGLYGVRLSRAGIDDLSPTSIWVRKHQSASASYPEDSRNASRY